jgi:uncharacterized protein (DUF2147 family)
MKTDGTQWIIGKMLTVVLLALAPFLSAQAQQDTDLEGIWKSPDGTQMMQINKIGDLFQGRIVWLKEATADSGKPLLDVNNPDTHMQKMPLKGKKIVEDLRYDGQGRLWSGGTYYQPATGKIQKCHAQLQGSDQLILSSYRSDPANGSKEVWIRQK